MAAAVSDMNTLDLILSLLRMLWCSCMEKKVDSVVSCLITSVAAGGIPPVATYEEYWCDPRMDAMML